MSVAVAGAHAPATATDGAQFCRELPLRARVAAIPCSAFRHSAGGTGADPLVRFAFCKSADVVHEATARLTGLGKG